MDQLLAALLGATVGFFLPTVARLIKSRILGKRFVNALKQELSQAKDSIHQKMLWMSRDISGDKAALNGTLVVSCGQKTLF